MKICNNFQRFGLESGRHAAVTSNVTQLLIGIFMLCCIISSWLSYLFLKVCFMFVLTIVLLQSGVFTQDMMLTTHLHLVLRSKNEWHYNSIPPICLHGVVLS